MIVGTAGHIDHGKTALVRALTGTDADRLKEEKARGITIELGFAYMPGAGGGTIGFVDVPGHERLIRTMLAGATGIDFALLIVAADDGPMPQTREHLAILDLLGIARGAVALTKVDLVDADRLAAAMNEAGNLLLGTALEGAEVVPVSSVTGEGVDYLREVLIEAAQAPAPHPADGGFRLAVDRSFTLQGTGTVVTGTVLSGRVAVGDQVTVSPPGLAARVRGLHAQNRKADAGRAGDRCALNLAGPGITREAVQRGDMVLAPALHAPCDRIDARLKVLVSETRPVGQWMPVHLHHGAAEVGARVVLLGDPVAPGAEGLVQLVLDRPIAAAAGDRFVLRDTSAQRTLGGGRFIDLRAPSRRRRTPERLAWLEAMANPDPGAALSDLLARPPHYIDFDAFARDRALSPDQAAAISDKAGLVAIRARDRMLAIAAATWPRLEAAITGTLGAFHAENPDLSGMGMERLRLRVEPRLPAPAFASVLRDLTARGLTAFDGAWVKLPGHEVRLSPADEELWEQIAPMIGGAERFRPPRVRDIARALEEPETEIRHLFKQMSRAGKVDEIAHDHFFLRATVAEMTGIAEAIATGAEGGRFTAAQFRDQLDNGRKVAIYILEFFDRHGVTIRRGDLRRMNPHRLDLFRRPAEDGPEAGVSRPEGGEASPVGRPDFKSGWGRETVSGGFDSHSLPPVSSGRMP